MKPKKLQVLLLGLVILMGILPSVSHLNADIVHSFKSWYYNPLNWPWGYPSHFYVSHEPNPDGSFNLTEADETMKYETVGDVLDDMRAYDSYYVESITDIYFLASPQDTNTNYWVSDPNGDEIIKYPKSEIPYWFGI